MNALQETLLKLDTDTIHNFNKYANNHSNSMNHFVDELSDMGLLSKTGKIKDEEMTSLLLGNETFNNINRTTKIIQKNYRNQFIVTNLETPLLKQYEYLTRLFNHIIPIVQDRNHIVTQYKKAISDENIKSIIILALTLKDFNQNKDTIIKITDKQLTLNLPISKDLDRISKNNKRILAVFERLNLISEDIYTKTIHNYYTNTNLDNDSMLTLKFKYFDKEEQTDELDQVILKYIRENKATSRKALENYLNVSERTVQLHINNLLTQNKIISIGKKNSPNRIYELLIP